MINITNETAAREARELARDLMGTSLSVFGRLPAGTGLAQLLQTVGVLLRAEERRPSRVPYPHETVVLIANHAVVASSDHERAVRELTEFQTAELRDEDGPLTADDVDRRRSSVRIDLTGRRDKLSAPLGLVTRFPGLRSRAEARRSEQRAEQVAAVVSALIGVPLPGPTFDEVAAATMSAAGVAAGQLGGLHEIKKQSQARHREFRARWETVLMLVWEAIATDETGPDAEFSLEDRRRRFDGARARARQMEKAEAEARRRASEERVARERAHREAQVKRRIEAHRKERAWERQPSCDPELERELDAGLDY